jgi:hypothetical protein
MIYGWWRYGAASLAPVLIIVFVVATLVIVAWALRMLGPHRNGMTGHPGGAA